MLPMMEPAETDDLALQIVQDACKLEMKEMWLKESKGIRAKIDQRIDKN